jgi:hypothetical protein
MRDSAGLKGMPLSYPSESVVLHGYHARYKEPRVFLFEMKWYLFNFVQTPLFHMTPSKTPDCTKILYRINRLFSS